VVLAAPSQSPASSLAALLVVAGSFCSAHYHHEQPDEIRIKFRSGKKFAAPMPAERARPEDVAGPAGEGNGELSPPPVVAPVKCPGCATAILKLLAKSEVRLTMPAIADALDDAGQGYSDSALSQTLGWLTASGLLVNVTGSKPRGYEFATG
jgi:hypothetical protein